MLRKALRRWLGVETEADAVDNTKAAFRYKEDNPYLTPEEAFLVRDYLLTAATTLGPYPWVCNDYLLIRHSFAEAIVVPTQLILGSKEDSLTGVAWEVSKLFEEETTKPDVESFIGQGYNPDWVMEEASDPNDVRAESVAFIDASLEGNREGAIRTLVALNSKVPPENRVGMTVDFLSQMLLAFAVKLFEQDYDLEEDPEEEEGDVAG